MKHTQAATRIVLDTNIVMDMLHFRNVHTQPLQEAIEGGRLTCYTDRDCLAELWRVTGYPAFALDDAAREALLARYRGFVQVCDAAGEEHYPLPRCRDADDQKFLILAARCAAATGGPAASRFAFAASTASRAAASGSS